MRLLACPSSPPSLFSFFLSFFFFLKMLDQCWTKKKIKNKPRDVSLHHQSLCFRTSQFEHPLWLMSPSTRPWKRWRQRTFKNLEIQLFHKCFLFLFSFFLGGGLESNSTKFTAAPRFPRVRLRFYASWKKHNVEMWRSGEIQKKTRKPLCG